MKSSHAKRAGARRPAGPSNSRSRGPFSTRQFAVRLASESLESRALLSGASMSDEMCAMIAAPLSTAAPAATLANNSPVGITPAQSRAAYGMNQILIGNVTGDGAGQTIAIVAAYDAPTVRADLQKFDATFGLSDPPNFSIYKQPINGRLPRADAGWSSEIALDVQWAHAAAPKANILLVEAFDDTITNLVAGVDYARHQPGVSVVSMSWGAAEFANEKSYDSTFTTPAGHVPVTFVAASGDSGAPGIWPAVSSNVLAVGGTTLTLNAAGGYGAEIAWGSSGGGLSKYVAEPSYQRSVQSTGFRSSPDVAFNASTRSGFAVYDSYDGSGWSKIGGTSAGAPQWAGLIAIANQGRALQNLPPLTNVISTIYSLPSSDFHDITSGSNGYAATAGYDYATGRGTPVGGNLVKHLISFGTTATSTAVTTPTIPTTTTGAKPVTSVPVAPSPYYTFGYNFFSNFFGSSGRFMADHDDSPETTTVATATTAGVLLGTGSTVAAPSSALAVAAWNEKASDSQVTAISAQPVVTTRVELSRPRFAQDSTESRGASEEELYQEPAGVVQFAHREFVTGTVGLTPSSRNETAPRGRRETSDAADFQERRAAVESMFADEAFADELSAGAPSASPAMILDAAEVKRRSPGMFGDTVTVENAPLLLAAVVAAGAWEVTKGAAPTRPIAQSIRRLRSARAAVGRSFERPDRR